MNELLALESLYIFTFKSMYLQTKCVHNLEAVNYIFLGIDKNIFVFYIFMIIYDRWIPLWEIT